MTSGCDIFRAAQAETFQFLLIPVTCQLQSGGTRRLGPGPGVSGGSLSGMGPWDGGWG